MSKRNIISAISIIAAFALIPVLTLIDWSAAGAYLAYAALVVIFFGILVSNQQYEEDNFAKLERVASAFLLSYIIFFRFFHAPFSQFFFGAAAAKNSFAVDVFSLILFIFSFFLFGTAFLVINTYSRIGFLANWSLFNNEKAYLVFRALFLTAVGILMIFYLRNSFFSISSSRLMNSVFPARTCNWTYIKYPNFLSMGRTVAGRDVCLYNYAQDRSDPAYCGLITQDIETQDLCEAYFVP